MQVVGDPIGATSTVFLLPKGSNLTQPLNRVNLLAFCFPVDLASCVTDMVHAAWFYSPRQLPLSRGNGRRAMLLLTRNLGDCRFRSDSGAVVSE